MRNSEYFNMVYPAGTPFGGVGSGYDNCCNSHKATGASAAASPQQLRTDSISSGAAAGFSSGAVRSSGRGSCKCWWVALAAVVVIAVVAR